MVPVVLAECKVLRAVRACKVRLDERELLVGMVLLVSRVLSARGVLRALPVLRVSSVRLVGSVKLAQLVFVVLRV